MSLIIRGRAHVYSRAHINTDEIIPARYLTTHDFAELAKHAMEDIDKDFVARVQPGVHVREVARVEQTKGGAIPHLRDAIWDIARFYTGAVNKS